jgi:lysophospholipase L1-like esterase
MVKREWLLLAGATTATVFLGLVLVRWLAPGLVGAPRDLQLVQVAREVPAFYDNVFRDEDWSSDAFMLNDPVTIKRARPLMSDQVSLGPHDVLGFRNRAVPNIADVVVIGDSQTYGTNVPIEWTWPSRLAEALGSRRPTVYNMSCAGWDGVQYVDMAEKALRFRPRVLVLAFYTGNDPRGAFTAAYGAERWADLRPDRSLQASDAAPLVWPVPKSEKWAVKLPGGGSTMFTPTLRLASNDREAPATRAGYAILAEVAARVSALAREAGVAAAFTVIPTKELAYEQALRDAAIPLEPSYEALVAAERANIAELAAALRGLEHGIYVDVVTPLERATRQQPTYPETADGHPIARGYQVIGATVARALAPLVPEPPRGLLIRPDGETGWRAMLADGDGAWMFTSEAVLEGNGWTRDQGREISRAEAERIPVRGVIGSVRPERWGPEAAPRP